jgi:hypothetical protein
MSLFFVLYSYLIWNDWSQSTQPRENQLRLRALFIRIVVSVWLYTTEGCLYLKQGDSFNSLECISYKKAFDLVYRRYYNNQSIQAQKFHSTQVSYEVG